MCVGVSHGAYVTAHPGVVQGIREPGILSIQSGEEHARLRKAFNVFFNTDNISAVISELTAEVKRACLDISEKATKAPDGMVAVDVTDPAASIINEVVRKVRCPGYCDVIDTLYMLYAA
jgi:hypothetical protein